MLGECILEEENGSALALLVLGFGGKVFVGIEASRVYGHCDHSCAVSQRRMSCPERTIDGNFLTSFFLDLQTEQEASNLLGRLLIEWCIVLDVMQEVVELRSASAPAREAYFILRFIYM